MSASTRQAFEILVFTPALTEPAILSLSTAESWNITLKPELQRAIQDSGFEHPVLLSSRLESPAIRSSIMPQMGMESTYKTPFIKESITHLLHPQYIEQNMTCISCGVETGSKVTEFADHLGDVMSISINPTNQHVFISGACDAIVKMWDIRTGTAAHTFAGHVYKIRAGIITAKGLLFAGPRLNGRRPVDDGERTMRGPVA